MLVLKNLTDHASEFGTEGLTDANCTTEIESRVEKMILLNRSTMYNTLIKSLKQGLQNYVLGPSCNSKVDEIQNWTNNNAKSMNILKLAVDWKPKDT